MSSKLEYIVKRVLGNPLTNLGSLEGDYRFANLKDDINHTMLYMGIMCFSIIAMSWVDYVLFNGQPGPFRLMFFYRVGYVLMTALFGVAIYRSQKVRIYDRLGFSWAFVTILFLILFNFTRPANYLSTSVDIIVPFAIYILSPLRFRLTFLLAFVFSASTLYVDFFMKSGVEPFILSVATFAQLIAHVLGSSSAVQLQSYRRKSFRAYIDEKDAREVAAYLANIDVLTKSLTRRQFMSIAEQEFLRFKRYQRPFSILILDADRFKQINDTYGHHAGDLTLRSLSLVSMEQKRAQDTFGRLGGEEFALLMPETKLENALVVAERIRQVWERSPVNLDGELISSTMSIGVAEADLNDKSLEDLLRRADRMLYKAKESGRNRVTS